MGGREKVYIQEKQIKQSNLSVKNEGFQSPQFRVQWFCHPYLSFILKQRPIKATYLSSKCPVCNWKRKLSFSLSFLVYIPDILSLQKESEWYQLTYPSTFLPLKGLSPPPGLRITGEASFYLSINRIPLVPGIPRGLNLLSQKQRTPQWQQKVISISLAVYIVSKALHIDFLI